MSAKPNLLSVATIVILTLLTGSGLAQEQNRDARARRSQRVKMPEIRVASPDGQLKFTVLPNAERLGFTVTSGKTTVIEPSSFVMNLDGFDLSSGVIFSNTERFEISETYPWHGAHSTATNRCAGVRIFLQHDLSFVNYTLEVRAFNDGVGYRFIIPGADDFARVPDERSSFVLPAGTTVWFHDLEGHYEAAYEKRDISEVKAGQWAGPPLTFQLPAGAGYGSITEANLANYAGMALECDGRNGWVVGLGHRQPVNYPYELRYGREEAKRLGKPLRLLRKIDPDNDTGILGVKADDWDFEHLVILKEGIIIDGQDSTVWDFDSYIFMHKARVVSLLALKE